MLHVRDLVVPTGVTVLTDPDEPLARVQPPRAQEEFAAIGCRGPPPSAEAELPRRRSEAAPASLAT